MRALFLCLGALVIGLFHVAPNLLSRTSSHFPAVPHRDEAHYLIRLKAALAGDSTLSCPLDPALGNQRTFIPSSLERAWAQVLRPFVGTDAAAAFKASYFVLPALAFAAMAALLALLTRNFAVGFGVAAWGMLEHGTYYWKPMLFAERDLVLPFLRFLNPMALIVPLLVALYALVRAERSKGAAWLLIGAITMGSLFFTQVFYWSWFVGTLCVAAVIALAQRDRSGAWRLGALAALGTVFAGIEVWRSLALRADPLVSEVLHRLALSLSSHKAHFLFHKGLIVTFVLYQWACRKRRDQAWRLLTAGMIAGYLLLNQPLLTGVSSQEHHYFRPLNVLFIVVVADLLGRYWNKRVAVAFSALALVACGMAAYRVRTLAADTELAGSYGKSAAEIERTLARMRELSKENGGTVLVDAAYAYAIALRTGLPVYIENYTFHCMISDAELFARWGLLQRAQGRSAAEYGRVLESIVNHELPWWIHGVPSDFKGRKDRNWREDKALLAQAVAGRYNERSIESFASELLRSGAGLPKLALSGPAGQLDEHELRRAFSLELLAEVPQERTRLWKLAPKAELKP